MGHNWWREHVVGVWSALDEAWRARCEDVAMGYATEVREFRETYPRPTFKIVLIQQRFKYMIEESS